MATEKIGIIPLDFSAPFSLTNLAGSIATILSGAFPSTTRITAEVLQAMPMPERASARGREAWLADVLIDELSERKNGCSLVLALTRERILQNGRLLVMGASRMDRHAGVLSTAGLEPETGAMRANALYFERTVKEAVHTAAHLFGLMHCPDERCIMHLSGGHVETDRKLLGFCPVCGERLRRTYAASHR